VTAAAAVPTHQLALSGPSQCLDAPHWPVRGDLAHVRLAGICFVPHYAVPMPHGLTRDAPLKVKPHGEAETREALSAGETFNVLDIAGGWAWGQVGEDGCVGYLPLEALEARRG
jgi:hypothetical protein